ncbi:LOW QUALITY PROTEIN: thrombopoietin receptor [Neosynchiropus ocellatus]
MLKSCSCRARFQSNMTLLSRWSPAAWIAAVFVWGHFSDGSFHLLSRQDRLLLKDQDNPKCFTRTEDDFTCFVETEDNGTYHVFYSFHGASAMKRCETSSWRTEDLTFLHVCSFPASDVHSFVDVHLKVVESKVNRTVYSRTVSVEDHFLLSPPFNVTLHPTDRVGQLLVSWHQSVPAYWKEKERFRIRHSSEGRGEKIKEGSKRSDDTVITLAPGDVVRVQVSVKCGYNEKAGHWSSWSPAVRAVAPQSGDDVSLLCFTADLLWVTCQWSSGSFGNSSQMFYKMHLSEALSWTAWTECVTESHVADSCTFRAALSKKVKVRILTRFNQLVRTFSTPEFALQSRIRTSPPAQLEGAPEEEGKLCLRWEAPSLSVSARLLYEVAHQTGGQSAAWTTSSPVGPSTETCLEVPAGTHYRVRVRAKPDDDSTYSGHWSDWSDELSGDTPPGTDAAVMMSIPVTLLVVALILFALFPSYLNKVKEHIWPPVPNLDKVLQSFLTEIDSQKWELSVAAKQCLEETSPSVVEVMSSDEASEPASFSSSEEQLEISPGEGQFPEYVTLNRDSLSLCLVGNKYICDQPGEKRGAETHSEGPEVTGPCTDTRTNFLNHSYLALAEAAGGLGAAPNENLYTNL